MQFPYLPIPVGVMGQIDMPFLPIRLTHNSTSVDDVALIDSGSAVSVLPYDVGIRLGLDWNAPMPPLPLGGILGRHIAKGLSLQVRVGNYPPVPIAFAWSQAPDARLIVGEVNFFSEFDVSFHRSRRYFEVIPKP
jgi:hypothetical protein